MLAINFLLINRCLIRTKHSAIISNYIAAIIYQMLCLSGFMTLVIGMRIPVLAQITPDNSLGNERSQVNRNATVQGRRVTQIEGGARRGANLFHSFSEFNVNKGQRVYFDNPDRVENILGRVTGNDISDILGTLGVNGTANLFLLNPNGIIFGDSARLDIQGSFLASTADSLRFDPNFAFSAIDPQAPPLLTVSAPIGLQIGSQPGAISSQADLSINPERSLILVGGEIALDESSLQVSTLSRENGGRIELNAITSAGEIGLQATGQIFALNVPSTLARGDISLKNQSRVRTTANNGGEIIFHSRNLEVLDQSRILAGIVTGQGTPQSQSGDVILNATGAITLADQSVISNSVNPASSVLPAAVGNSGDIQIRASSLSITDGSQLIATTQGQGNAGNVRIAVDDQIVVEGIGTNGNSSAILSRVNPGAIGNAGNMQITAGSLRISDGAQLIASTQGTGDAGDVVIRTRDRIIVDDGVVFSRVAPRAIGNAGDIRIWTNTLRLVNGGQLQANTESQGNAGNVTIRARNQVNVSGNNSDGFASAIFSGVENNANGEAGSIQIRADLLSIGNGASLFTRSNGTRQNAGDVLIQANRLRLDQGQINAETLAQAGGNINLVISDSIQLENDSRITASTQFGQGGDITVNTIDTPVPWMMSDRSLVAVQATRSGDAGNLALNVRQLALQDSEITASTRSGRGGDLRIQGLETLQMHRSRIVASTNRGEAGNLTVNARSIELNDRSRLSVAATGPKGQAGNLFLNTDRLMVRERSSVTVSSRAGQAGNLNVTANQISLDRGRLTAETAESPENNAAANLRLNDLDLLLMQNSSLLSAEAIDAANGGNVAIKANNGFVVASSNQNNDIIANADRGAGGEIQITTQGLFGLEEGRTLPPNSTNDIDASSQFGIQGTVTINQLNVDPSRGLTELPSDVLDVANQIERVCPTPSIGNQPSEFIVTGRGGLPVSPLEPLASEALLADWVVLEPSYDRSAQSSVSSPDPLLIEAQGWQMGAEGEVIFVANVSTGPPSLDPLSETRTSPHCP